MRPTLKRILGLGVVATAGYAVWRAFDARRVDTDVTWMPQPFPYPPQPRARAKAPSAARDGWIDPIGDACPATHPLKAKLASGIFHLPGGRSYARTKPDRCYASAEAAIADGLRASKV